MTLSDAEMVKALRELASTGECEAPLSFGEVADRLEQLTSAREHTITGCSECCLCDGVDGSCCHPDAGLWDGGLDEYTEPHPDCPLREKATVLRVAVTP